MSYTAGYEAILGYKIENVTSVSSYAPSGGVPALASGAPTFIGYANVPEVRTERESKKGFGIGSPYASFNARGTRKYSVNIDAPLVSKDFLELCLRGDSGYKGLPDLALYTGTANNLDSGFTRVIRLAKCNTFTLDLKEGSAQEVRMQSTFMGLFEEDLVDVFSPTADQLKSAGTPQFWNTVSSVYFKDAEYRDVISGINIQCNHNLKPRGFRPGVNDSLSLQNCHYAIVPGKFTGKATLTFHERLKDVLRKSSANSSLWGDIQVQLHNGTTPITLTLTDCLLDPDYQNSGGDGDEPMAFGCEVHFSKLTVA